MLRRRTTFQEIALATIVIAVVAVLSITYALLNVNADALKRSADEYAISVAECVAYRVSNEIEGIENAIEQIINIFSSPGISAADKVEMAKAIMVLESVDFIAVYDRNGKRIDLVASGAVVVPRQFPRDARSDAIENGRYYTHYHHLMPGKGKKVGDVVRKGDVIGYLDNNGVSSGSHLHWQLNAGSPAYGAYIYPCDCLGIPHKGCAVSTKRRY